jgi:hypothetical protein
MPAATLLNQQTLLDTASQMVYYIPEHNYLHVQWLGHHDANTALEGCKKTLELVRATGCTRLLNDSSEAFGEWRELARWIGATFVPQLQAAGVEAIAWVNAMDWPARSCVASSMHYLREPVVAAFEFDELDAAHDWLRKAGR